MAIEDINPQAPTHLLVFPVTHVPSVASLDSATDGVLIAHLVSVATELGRKHGGNEGFRLVVNTGLHGGQTVDHVHVHVLAGRHMGWPPG